MLTTKFDKSYIPICEVKGGPDDGEIIFCIDNEEEKSKFKGKEAGYHFNVLGGKLQQLPNKKVRVLYIAGPSGSGKSTYTSNYVKEYLEIYPKTNIVLLSKVNSDVAFECLNFKRFVIDESIIENPPQIEEVPDHSLVVFDDIDTVSNKKLMTIVQNFITQLLELGRHSNIQVIITSHLILGNCRAMSRTCMNELHSFTFFPQAGGMQQIEYALRTYFGFDRKQAIKAAKIKSRWVTIFKIYPQIILSEHDVQLLSDFQA